VPSATSAERLLQLGDLQWSTASGNGVDTTEVREWAKAQGIDVKDCGRVPAELVVKFKAATGR
jgi:Lsr2